MKTFIQWLLIVWFVSLALLALIPSIRLLSCVPEQVTVDPLPTAPDPPQDSTDPTALSIYTQQVAAYNASVTAYKSRLDDLRTRDFHATYELVVRNTLTTLMATIVGGLATFAFARALDNNNRMRHNREPERLTFF